MQFKSPLVYAEVVDGLSPPDPAAGAPWVEEKDIPSWCWKRHEMNIRAVCVDGWQQGELLALVCPPRLYVKQGHVLAGPNTPELKLGQTYCGTWTDI